MKNTTPNKKEATKKSDLKVEHDLEKAIPFLLARAGTRMGNAFSQALKPYELNLSEWRVCASLQYAPNQTMSELSLHASTDLSALSRILDRLSESGFVKKERCNDDGRAVRLSLTAKGAKLTRALIPLAKHYEDVAITDFTTTEIDLLRKMLIRLYVNTDKIS